MHQADSTVEAAEARSASASTTLRTILTEFALSRDAPVPHAAVVRVMELVGFEAAAARQAISRAARAGALLRPPDVARGEVMLSGDGRGLLGRMTEVSDAAAPPWDGQWTVIFARGRIDRSPDHATRNRVLLQNFGSLGGGLWIAPHSARTEAAIGVIASDPTVDLVGGAMTVTEPDTRSLIEKAWNLDAVRRVYTEFTDLAEGLAPRDDEETLAAWVVLRRQWFSVTHADPGLPAEALPEDWPGSRARTVMSTRRAQWWEVATRGFERLL